MAAARSAPSDGAEPPETSCLHQATRAWHPKASSSPPASSSLLFLNANRAGKRKTLIFFLRSLRSFAGLSLSHRGQAKPRQGIAFTLSFSFVPFPFWFLLEFCKPVTRNGNMSHQPPCPLSPRQGGERSAGGVGQDRDGHQRPHTNILSPPFLSLCPPHAKTPQNDRRHLPALCTATHLGCRAPTQRGGRPFGQPPAEQHQNSGDF